MDKNLQNIDDVFNQAYHSFEDEPSGATWEKLNAALDKEDAEKYKRRFIGWKRIAVLLLFLLAGFMIYETGVVIKRKNEPEFSKNENTADSTFVTGNPEVNNNNKKKTNGTTNTGRQDENISFSDSERRVQQQPTEVLTETNQNKISSPVDKQGARQANEQIETVATAIKLSSAGKKTIKGKTKVVIKPAVIAVDDETGDLADDNLLKNKKNSTKLKDKQTGYGSDNERDSIRKVLISAIGPVKRTEITSPLVTGITLKAPLLPALVTTANTAQPKKKKSPSVFKPFWSATAFASNDWGQYQLDNDVQDNSGNQQNEKEEISRREKHEASYSAGVMVTRQFTKHLGLKTGLVYSNTAIGISPQEMYAAQKTDGSIAYKYITSSGYGFVKPGFGLPPAIGDSILSTEAQHNLQMISVPLMVSYRFEKKKLSVSPAVGLSANFITSANVKTEVKDALNKEAVTINGLDGMRKFYTGFIADVNIQYNVNRRWSFNLLPAFKYAVTPITKSNVVKTFPYSFNVGAGITYKF